MFVDTIHDMTSQIGPGLRRRQLAAELTRLRAAAGKDQMQAAAVLDCSRPRISNLESGRAIPSKLELPALLTLYDAMDRLPALEELRVAANRPGWWSTFGLPIWLQAYVRLETDATQVRCYAGGIVPGLLQTEDYARAVLRLHGSPDTDTEQRIAVLRERQNRLGRMRLSVTVSEALLHWTASLGEVGAGQLRHLADTSTDGVAEVRVLAFEAGLRRGVSGQFTVLDFPEGSGLPTAYQEHAVGGHLADEREVVGTLSDLYQELRTVALDSKDSEAMIRQFALKQKEGTLQ